MKTIYIDYEYMCFTHMEEGMRAVETDVFDGKCDAFIRGHRFIPEGENWTRPDGVVITGEAVFPWRDFAILEAVQQKYEETSEELTAALAELAEADEALHAVDVYWEEENNGEET